MKIQIRKNVFETNSSSVHTFTRSKAINNIEVSEDGFVHVSLYDYDEMWPCYGAYDKLVYTILIGTHCAGFIFHDSVDFLKEYNEFKISQEFKAIEDVIKARINCKGIIIDESYGYVDHQVRDEVSNFDEFVAFTGAECIEDFIFGDWMLVKGRD